jgi:hypothetical protein
MAIIKKYLEFDLFEDQAGLDREKIMSKVV